MPKSILITGDCREVLRDLPDRSVDACVTDPPYPEIDRDYGRLSEYAWHELIDVVILGIKRVLKHSGSAMLVLQPNSERVGQLRPWLWEFLAKWTRKWNMIQDVWWWNHTAPPTVHCQRRYGLMRPSLKVCAWFGAPDCYRNQNGVLWATSEAMKAIKHEDRALRYYPSGVHIREGRIAATVSERGGVTPFNLLPIANANSVSSGGAKGHGAATPDRLCEWWIKYIVPPGGLVLDPFSGAGTTGIAANNLGHNYVGIELNPENNEIARARIEEAGGQVEVWE